VTKRWHEIRDPIHVFVRLDTDERKVVDSRPLQRLRDVHQLAMTYLVYPGATHRRFEHSLGVMELASRVYDVVTNPRNVHHDAVRSLVPEWASPEHTHWRSALRMAALCHDIGHLPFSHAAEDELLPEGWDHERLTWDLIHTEELSGLLDGLELQPGVVAKLAVGPKNYKKYRDDAFGDWEEILSEIIVGDSFGVDRIDYLLRDSLHAGVAYGRFDHYRLIDTLRILPKSDDSKEPGLGIEDGGIHSAEALLLARYFMYTQLYFHPVRRIYDIHLMDFLNKWLDGGRFATDIEMHLSLTDSVILSELRTAAQDENARGHAHARRILQRQHFRLLYERNPADFERNPEAGRAVAARAADKFDKERVRLDRYRQKGSSYDFPVLLNDGRIVSSLRRSMVLKSILPVALDNVFVDPDVEEEAKQWLEANREMVIAPEEEEG
jgi:HD superfamily phosphohydrolase